MKKDLNKLLDKCIDRINEGESLKACLASYPEHAHELEPLLRAMWDFRDACSPIPRDTAKSATRQRIEAALVNSSRESEEYKRRIVPLFGWTRAWATAAVAIVVALVGFGLYWTLTLGETPLVVAQPNFRLLLSDEENAINDFKSLEVTITSIGVQSGGESGSWEIIDLDPGVVRDLTDLQGLNAQEIWNGELPEGQYTKVFIYIDDVSGTINDGLGEVTLPSEKLHISKPFAVTAGESIVNFVYDVTVIQDGNSGQYILLPQANESGANHAYHELSEGEITLEVILGEVTPGEEITVLATFEGSPVEDDAIVTVNDDYFSATTTDGEVTFVVPFDDELDIEVVWGELEGEIEIDLQWESEEGKIILEVIAGEVTPGEEITVLATFEGSPVEDDAIVTVNDDYFSATTTDGEVTFVVPFDDELDIEVVWGILEGDLDIDLEWAPEEGKIILEVVDGDTLLVIDKDDVTSGQSVRVLVTSNEGNPFEAAEVIVEDVGVFSTGNNGITTDYFFVPFDDELEIEAVYDGLKGELEIDLEYDDGDTEEADHGDVKEEDDVDTEEANHAETDEENKLTLRVVDNVTATAGEGITIHVTFNDGSDVEGATVWVNDEELDEKTSASGFISFDVPYEDKLEIEVVYDGLEGELDINLE